jgi:hypothetical protein
VRNSDSLAAARRPAPPATLDVRETDPARRSVSGRDGGGLPAVILLAYVLSRGIAKAGSNEVVRTDDN